MWQTFLDVWAWLGTWLKNHEWLAIWLEGVALILLFGLERRQFRHEREKSKQSNLDTLEQLEIAKKQAEAARLTAQSVVNSERAWLIVTPTLPNKLRVGAPHSGAIFRWAIKNVGRTPARIIETDAAAWRVKDLTTIPAVPKYEGRAVLLNRFLLVPNDSVGFGSLVEPFGDEFTSEQIHEITHRKLNLLAYGYVRYLDDFNREHTTRFCHTYVVRSMDAEGFEPYWNAPPEYIQCD